MGAGVRYRGRGVLAPLEFYRPMAPNTPSLDELQNEGLGGPERRGRGTYVRFHLSEHAVSVVPDAEEAEDMAIHLNKLFQFVVGGGSGV